MQEQAASSVYRMALPATALVVLDAREREMRRWRSVRAPAQRVSCMLYGGGERYRMVYLCEWSGEVVFVRLHTQLYGMHRHSDSLSPRT